MEKIHKDGHDSMFSIHPGTTKMSQDLKRYYWWPQMKNDITKYVHNCDLCQKVKTEDQRSGGVLQPLSILEWKLEHINIDFITGFPRLTRGNDAIWVVVDRLTKVIV